MAENDGNSWGRWGLEDQVGALNLLTPEKMLKAFRLVKKAKIYSLAVPLERDGPQLPDFHKTWKTHHFWHMEDPEISFVDDMVTMEVHSGTHIDALGHVWAEAEMYNGHPETEITSRGVGKNGIENVRHMVGRGIMLDLPAYMGIKHIGPEYTVTGEDLDGAAKAQGVSIETGDIVLVRTGWYTLFERNRALWSSQFPGPDGSLKPWLMERDICALGADHPTVEAKPPTYNSAPLHRYALRDLGIYLMESLDLEELARDRVYEFLFIGAPLRITGASGSPWNPLAIV